MRTGMIRMSLIVLSGLIMLQGVTSKNIYRKHRSQLEDDMASCAAPPSIQMVKFLDRVCEDCYMLYRDLDIYQMCRSECYSSDYFATCMDIVMVNAETRNRAASFVSLMNSYAT